MPRFREIGVAFSFSRCDIQTLHWCFDSFHCPLVFSKTIVEPWPQSSPHTKLKLIAAYLWFLSNATSDSVSNPAEKPASTALFTSLP